MNSTFVCPSLSVVVIPSPPLSLLVKYLNPQTKAHFQRTPINAYYYIYSTNIYEGIGVKYIF